MALSAAVVVAFEPWKPGRHAFVGDWPRALGDVAARAELRRACERARNAERLLLVEFSAPWCEQCQKVKSAIDADVDEALSRVEPVVMNIGDGRDLDAVRLELGARAIPYWTLVEPNECETPPREWKRVASMNPRPDPEELSSWLLRTAL